MEPLVNRPRLMSADGSSKLRTTLVGPKASFDAIKMADLAQQPVGDAWLLVTRLVKLSSGVRPAR
jgi:hypothetical protein